MSQAKQVGRPPTYPWRDMEAGDLFEVPLKVRDSAQRAGARWCVRNRPDHVVTSRKLDDEKAEIQMRRLYEEADVGGGAGEAEDDGLVREMPGDHGA